MVLRYIDEALQKQNKDSERPVGVSLGASSIGWSCSRQIQYLFRGQQRDSELTGKTLRVFARGHLLEAYVADLLRLAGFTLDVASDSGEQHGFRDNTDRGTRFSGRIDGIITSGPADIAYPCLWENKTANAKNYAKHVEKPVVVANPIYATQIAVYQDKMSLLNPALLTVLNVNTMELHVEEVAYDSHLASMASHKARYILTCPDDELMPRISDKEDYWECRFCAYKGSCWGKYVQMEVSNGY